MSLFINNFNYLSNNININIKFSKRNIRFHKRNHILNSGLYICNATKTSEKSSKQNLSSNNVAMYIVLNLI